MFRNTIMIGTITAALTIGGAVPAHAQAAAPAYRAVPVTPAAATGKVVVGDSLWSCGTEGCTTGSATARPAIVCEQAARKLGKFASFSVGDRAFDEAALAKCNAKARS